ncbi:phage protein [Herbaspirillum rubrisubalbicans]|uniref:Phage protein n=1 Tax=Herbaspirillum rubrisubalbicans TaxID=80842 RepID=A0ABX9BXQ6_9BURK|nr:BrnT family toxin [Herbaspirillum rubrisubalbicans]RAM62758.1 phage protein [Herbaspirillum rubrisubalbicans]RAN49352.1 phage protein [Herbaspirillum rubrisubalbicans]
MEITFDPNKDAVNKFKHGVSLAEAAAIEWDTALVSIDDRFDYGELREVAIAYIGLLLYVVVFVERHDVLRIISLRRATKREIERYAET